MRARQPTPEKKRIAGISFRGTLGVFLAINLGGADGDHTHRLTNRWPTTPASLALPLEPSHRSTMATDTPHAKTQTLSQRTVTNPVALRRPRLVVLSLKKEIEQALGEGLTLAELWRQLHAEGAFPAGYNRFRILVRRLITSPPAPRRPHRPRPTATSSATERDGSAGFTLSRNVDAKDLV
jgi:hypothetical protein